VDRAQECHKPNGTIDFSRLDIRDEIRPKVLKANARKLPGL
jgi:predicted TIM-barrel fold metal-dependent hydrolase